MPGGPQPFTHAQRMARAEEIAGRVRAHYGARVLAVGLYGSTARGTDGPYSDIEIFCVLSTAGERVYHEWSAGAWKAEVNAFSADVLLREAGELREDWPLTHGAYTQVYSFYDPYGFFPRLRKAVYAHSDVEYRQVMGSLVLTEIYERIGKIRNANAAARWSSTVELAVDLARQTAYLLGLAHRQLFTSASAVLEEALRLPDRPAGFDRLCALVMRGELSDGPAVCAAADALWEGVETWAQARQIDLDTDLESVLRGQPGRGSANSAGSSSGEPRPVNPQ